MSLIPDPESCYKSGLKRGETSKSPAPENAKYKQAHIKGWHDGRRKNIWLTPPKKCGSCTQMIKSKPIKNGLCASIVCEHCGSRQFVDKPNTVNESSNELEST